VFGKKIISCDEAAQAFLFDAKVRFQSHGGPYRIIGGESYTGTSLFARISVFPWQLRQSYILIYHDGLVQQTHLKQYYQGTVPSHSYISTVVALVTSTELENKQRCIYKTNQNLTKMPSYLLVH
jgi:hypothetical protein